MIGIAKLGRHTGVCLTQVEFVVSVLETGGICITPRPSESGALIKAGMPMRPFFGIDPALVKINPENVRELQ